MSSEKASSQRALLDLLRYAKPLRKRMWIATAYSVLNKLFDVMPEILIGVAIDVVVRRQDSFVAAVGVTEPFDQMILIGALTFLIWVGESLFEYGYLIMWRNLAQDLQHRLRLDAYRHVQDLDLSYFEDANTGNLVAILNDDVNQLERFFNGGANALIQVATTIVAVGSVFFLLSPLIALLAFAPIPVIVIGAFFFQRRAQPLYAEVRSRVGQLSSRLSANLSGITTIKSFVTEDLEAEQIDRDSQLYVEANRKAIAVSSAFIPIIRMAILAGFLATLVLGGWMALNGRINIGAYGILVFLTQRLLWPLTSLAETVDLYERAMASSRRILTLIKTPVEIVDQTDAHGLDRVEGEIIYENVSFNYATGGVVLSDINLRIKAGQTIALVGQTGSGKSTLVKLLLRFYEPQTGRVLIDGTPLNDIRIADLRRKIGLVSQDVFLFQGSIFDNIAYGAGETNHQAVRSAATAAEAVEFIDELQAGFDTVVGERGQKLSGGQRQRLSIARALLKDPPILILDEATSAVDNETEAAIQRSLRRITRGRTTIVVAHRLSTIVHADVIHVLDKGRIVESGDHEQLVSQNGIYAALWKVQTGDAQPLS